MDSKSGRNKFRYALKVANKQIKESGYETITRTEDDLPQGKLAIQILGEELKLSLDEISEIIMKECLPTKYLSLKEVAIYHENVLVRKFQRDPGIG